MSAETKPERLAAVLETLESMDTADRAEMLLSWADRFREVPEEVARRPFDPANRVPSCESEAYVWGILRPDGTLALHFAVENPNGISAKALATILERTLSGSPPEEIAGISPDIVYTIFRRDLSMGKGIGLMAMVQAVRALAREAAGGIAYRRQS